jgi:hypothetical protein
MRGGSTAPACRTSSRLRESRRALSTTTSTARKRWRSRSCGRTPLSSAPSWSRLAQLTSSRVRKGCLLGNFATELAPHSSDIATTVADALGAWSAAVAKALTQAQEAGELSEDADVDALGRYLVDGYEGAATRAKLIGDRAPMDEFIRTTFDYLLAARRSVT